MIAINPILGILILFVQPLIMFFSKKMSARTGELKAQENKAIAEFQESVGETLELFGQIKASNKEAYFFSKAIKGAKKIQEASNAFSFKSVAYEKLSYTIFLSVFELIRATGLLLVVYSDLSIGMMFAMFGYIWFIMTPVQDILSMQYSYASAKAALGRINKLLSLKHEANGEKKLLHKLSPDFMKKAPANFTTTISPSKNLTDTPCVRRYFSFCKCLFSLMLVCVLT